LAETRSRVQIVQYPNTRFTSPNIIVGIPEAGLVSTITATYLMQQLKLPEVGVVESDLLPQVVVVHESEPKEPVRIYGRRDLIVVLSETPLIPRLSAEISKEIVKWGKSIGCNFVVGVTGIPSPNRVQGEKETKPRVLYLTTEERLKGLLENAGADAFDEGVMVGAFASLLRQCMIQDQVNVTLLAEAYMEFPDPGASVETLQVLNRFLSLDIDLKPLVKESEEIRLRSRDLMSKTQQAMQQSTQGGQIPPSVYR
jgi:uncharacterized protein